MHRTFKRLIEMPRRVQPDQLDPPGPEVGGRAVGLHPDGDLADGQGQQPPAQHGLKLGEQPMPKMMQTRPGQMELRME